MTKDDDKKQYVVWQNFVWIVCIATLVVSALWSLTNKNTNDIQAVSSTVSELKGSYGQIEKSLERIEKKIESIK